MIAEEKRSCEPYLVLPSAANASQLSTLRAIAYVASASSSPPKDTNFSDTYSKTAARRMQGMRGNADQSAKTKKQNR